MQPLPLIFVSCQLALLPSSLEITTILCAAAVFGTYIHVVRRADMKVLQRSG